MDGEVRKIYAAVLALLTVLIPAQLSAKGNTVRITIKGASLTAPIEITDKDLLARFAIWTGPGTGSMSASGIITRNEGQGLIVDWSKGVTAEPSKGLELYDVEILTTRTGKNTYRVSYVYDRAKQEGYVYLPGKTDPRYGENVWLIYRGIEGNWFHAWSEWDSVVKPLLAKAR